MGHGCKNWGVLSIDLLPGHGASFPQTASDLACVLWLDAHAWETVFTIGLLSFL